MSRAGTPTDNPIIESINGWIKDEIYTDFNIDTEDDFESFIKRFVTYYNTERPSYKLDYKTPLQYRTEYETVSKY